MNPRVMLINPSENSSHEGNTRKPLNPNLGLAYIASFLKKECNVVVRMIEMHPYELSAEQLRGIVGDFVPDIVGITSKTFNILTAYKVANLVREINPKVVIVIGGAHATVLPELTLEECESINVVVRAEAELTMKEMIERFVSGAKDDDLFVELLGTTYRTKSGEIVNNSNRELISNLDELPFPDYSMFDLKSYGMLYDPIKHGFTRQFPVLTSRGCPYKCTFCAPILTRKFRQRSVENVIQEIELLVQEYKCNSIYFEDSTFCVNRKWFDKFCQELVCRGLNRKLSWGFESRAELVQDENIFKQAKDAGCIYVYYGIESGSSTVLDYAGKGITKDQIVNAVRLAKRAGINQVAGSFIFGLPYETRETIEETFDLIRELKLDTLNLNLVDIYPGTELWNMVERGDGGIEWLPNMRYDWATYSRATCQTIVNDLSEQDLVQILARARKELIRGFWEKGKKDFFFKLIAYFGYYLWNDPGQLVRYVRRYLIGAS